MAKVTDHFAVSQKQTITRKIIHFQLVSAYDTPFQVVTLIAADLKAIISLSYPYFLEKKQKSQTH